MPWVINWLLKFFFVPIPIQVQVLGIDNFYDLYHFFNKDTTDDEWLAMNAWLGKHGFAPRQMGLWSKLHESNNDATM